MATEVVTLDQAREHLNITGTDFDAEIIRFLDAATATAAGFLRGALVETSVTSRVIGGSRVLYLPERPVFSVEEIVDECGSASIEAADVWVDAFPGRLQVNALSMGWFPLDGTYTYTAAWPEPIPEDIRQGVLEILRHQWETQRGNSPGRPIAGFDEQGGQDYGILSRAMESLAPHRLALL